MSLKSRTKPKLSSLLIDVMSLSGGLSFFQLTKGVAKFDRKRFGKEIEIFEVCALISVP
jgi:hypothetical protein